MKAKDLQPGDRFDDRDGIIMVTAVRKTLLTGPGGMLTEIEVDYRSGTLFFDPEDEVKRV